MRLFIFSLLALFASGCAVAPTGPGEPASVTQDFTEFMRREWPLCGPSACQYAEMPGSGCVCSECKVGCPVSDCASSRYLCESEEQMWAEDWDAPDEMRPKVVKISRPPAVPNSGGPPGRFFPVPVQPVFTPQNEVTSVGVVN